MATRDPQLRAPVLGQRFFPIPIWNHLSVAAGAAATSGEFDFLSETGPCFVRFELGRRQLLLVPLPPPLTGVLLDVVNTRTLLLTAQSLGHQRY